VVVKHLMTTATSHGERARSSQVAVLPVGSFEQHSGFLPLITDTIVACVIADRISTDYDLFLLPPVTIACSHEHARFPGTVSISATTLAAIVRDVRASLAASGIERLVIVNGHGGNYVLSNIVQEANVGTIQATLFPARSDWDTARDAAGLETSTSDDMHAGELEVSLLLHACPELVGEGHRDGDWLANPRPHLLMTGTAGYTTSGVIGRPSLGTAEKGRALLASLTESFKDHLTLLGSAKQ
jgi:creatinine amidohydrolase